MEIAPKPWYREPWPWILATGPFIVIVAGFVTLWLAIRSNDGLVTDDYYLKGLAADQTIARSDRAKSLGIRAQLRLTANDVKVSLSAADAAFVPPARLSVTVSHPTRAGLDQTRWLEPAAEGYSAEFRLPASGHWLVLIEDDKKQWRLMGNVVLPAAGAVQLGGTP